MMHLHPIQIQVSDCRTAMDTAAKPETDMAMGLAAEPETGTAMGLAAEPEMVSDRAITVRDCIAAGSK